MLLYPRLCDKRKGEIQGKKAEHFEEKKKCGRLCFFVTLNHRKQLFVIKTPKMRLCQKNVVRKTMARELVSAFGTCLSCPGI